MTVLSEPIYAEQTCPEVFPLYNTHNDTSPSEYISMAGLVSRCWGSRVGPKERAPAFTPYKAEAKTKAAAEKAEYHALLLDHDDGDETAEEMRGIYDGYECAYLAYTSSSHQQPKGKDAVVANRWKGVIPYICPIDAERHTAISVGAALLLSTDKAQTRTQQICYAPNKLTKDAPFEFIDATDRPYLDPWDDEHPFIAACLANYAQYQEQQEKKAAGAKAKPRNVDGVQGTICQKARAAYRLSDVLEQYGYPKRGRAWLSPQSSTGNPGVHILQGNDGVERCYSHHGETDPLSSLNHDGHALDVVDVKCVLEHGGDFTATIAALAEELDPEGNKQRQIEYAKEKEKAGNLAGLGALADEGEENRPMPDDIHIDSPPGLAGKICDYINMTARRPVPELYPLTALHLMALVGHKAKSPFGVKLNLMTLGIAPSASGKEHPQEKMKQLAKDCYRSKNIFGNMGSFKEITENMLDGHGASLNIVDEVHSLLESVKSKNASTYESKIEAEILTTYATDLYTFRGADKRSKKKIYDDELKRVNQKIDKLEEDSEDYKKLEAARRKLNQKLDWLENGLPNPFFSFMGHSVPAKLDSFISADNIHSGLVGRSLVRRCPETRQKLRRGKVPEDHRLKELAYDIECGLKRIMQHNGDTIDVTSEAEQFLDTCVDWYEEDEQLNHPITGAIYARAPEHLYRVSTILGLPYGEIRLEHAHYADILVKQSIDDVRHILLKAYADTAGAAENAVLAHARQWIQRNCRHGMSHSRIKDYVTKPKGWKEMEVRVKAQDAKREPLEELLADMVEKGEIEKKTSGRGVKYVSF